MDLRKLEKQFVARCDFPYGSYSKPPIFVKAKNCHVWDINGKEYIDLAAGFSSVNLGHCNPKIIKAFEKQAKKLDQLHNQLNDSQIELCKKLSKLAGRNRKVLIDVGGSIAIENALKFAIAFKKKFKIACFEGCFHGRSLGLIPLTQNEPLKIFFSNNKVPTKNVVRLPFPYNYHKEDNCLNKIEKKLKSQKEVSCLIIESALGSGGYIFPSKKFMQALEKICKKLGILLIVDEIQMGLGRTGKIFCYQHYGINPDLIVISKSLGGATYPLSAVIGKAKIIDSVKPRIIYSTFTGNPLGSAIALEVLKIIKEERLCERSISHGKYFFQKLKRLKEKHSMIGNIEGKGLAIGIELIKNGKPAIKQTQKLIEDALQEGLLLKVGGAYKNRINISPPLTITKKDIDKALSKLDNILSEFDN